MKGEYHMSTKSNIRSFRYSDEVAEILEGFSGDSLNAKFENLVLHCYKLLPKKKKELNQITKQVEDKEKEYIKLCSQLQEVSSLISTLETLKRYGEIAARQAQPVIKKGIVTQGRSAAAADQPHGGA